LFFRKEITEEGRRLTGLFCYLLLSGPCGAVDMPYPMPYTDNLFYFKSDFLDNKPVIAVESNPA